MTVLKKLAVAASNVGLGALGLGIASAMAAPAVGLVGDRTLVLLTPTTAW